MGGHHSWPDRQDPVPPEAFIPEPPRGRRLMDLCLICGHAPHRDECDVQGCSCVTFAVVLATDTPTAVAGPTDLQHATHAANPVTADEAVERLRTLAQGAGWGLTSGHSRDAQALDAGADALEQLQAAQTQVQQLREVAEAAKPFAGSVDHGFHDEGCTPDYVDEPEYCHRSCPQPRLRAALAALDLAAPRKDTP